ncbi:MAG TPA: sigma-54 dependent transcriptional regulator [Kofleriaceae bacterium]|nr:sigma-54 dependent transcriptional regulator [Kofleriaceae bacterium]
MSSILLIDDDVQVVDVIGRFFSRRGWAVSRAGDGAAGIAAYLREQPDLVLLDLGLPDRPGLDVLRSLREQDADATVLVLTGNADIAAAVSAMRLGAENFLTKPIELTHLEAATERALERVALRRRNRHLARQSADEAPALASIGRSPAMREVARSIELLAPGNTSVLLLGETGTGKGWLARLIHSLSPRASAPFVEINCAGLTPTFLDSELFGHEKGAFTDARTQKPGLFEVANGGTLFLDEVGDLAPELQPKLLKALESRRFRRLGGTREIEVDVRLIAATNRDLDAAVRAGAFREDLYYRLAVLPLRLPPLRERGRDDVIDLALALPGDLHRQIGRGPSRFAPDTLDLIAAHAWPGNIRQLRNTLERMLLLAGDADELLPVHLPPEITSAGAAPAPDRDVDLTLAEVERRHIHRVLVHHAGNRSRAARALGISRATLYEKIRRYGLEASGRRTPA